MKFICPQKNMDPLGEIPFFLGIARRLASAGVSKSDDYGNGDSSNEGP